MKNFVSGKSLFHYQPDEFLTVCAEITYMPGAVWVNIKWIELSPGGPEATLHMNELVNRVREAWLIEQQPDGMAMAKHQREAEALEGASLW